MHGTFETWPETIDNISVQSVGSCKQGWKDHICLMKEI